MGIENIKLEEWQVLDAANGFQWNGGADDCIAEWAGLTVQVLKTTDCQWHWIITHTPSGERLASSYTLDSGKTAQQAAQSHAHDLFLYLCSDAQYRLYRKRRTQTDRGQALQMLSRTDEQLVKVQSHLETMPNGEAKQLLLEQFAALQNSRAILAAEISKIDAKLKEC